MTNVIAFYDIASNLPDNPWAAVTWRIRYSLNYKGLAFKTVWVEYPDVEEVCKKLGAAPTETKQDGSPKYTLPVIVDPSTGAVISDGPAIADYLEDTYPSTPKLFPSGTRTLQHAFLDAHGPTLDPLWICIVPSIHGFLNPPSQEYFRSTREKLFGKKLEAIAPTGQEATEQWAKVKEGFGKVDSWLKRSDGIFFMGDTVSFADFTVVSYVKWITKVLGEDSKEWQEVKGWHGGRWEKLLKACEKYESVN